MKRATIITFITLLFFATAAHAQGCPGCYFYGGDLDVSDPNQNALANENDAIVPTTVLSPNYGAATFQNFIVGGAGINVTGLFTNNLSDLHPTSAFWEICPSIPAGPGCSSGTATGANFTWTQTSRSDFGYLEYKAWAQGLSVNLGPGQWWFAVVPQAPTEFGRSFNSNANTGLNQVGNENYDQQYFDSKFFGANFDNANNWGVFRSFSSGVYDDPLYGDSAPEPSSLVLLGSGLVGIAGVVRSKLNR